jgi:uncharacterized protein YjbJ (UPF0337 family)
MNKDRAEGKVKDIAGRVERQVGEWTDNPKMQVKGAAKQAKGKVQNAFGQGKDAAKQAADDVRAGSKAPQRVPEPDAEEAESKDARRRG